MTDEKLNNRIEYLYVLRSELIDEMKMGFDGDDCNFGFLSSIRFLEEEIERTLLRSIQFKVARYDMEMENEDN